MGGYLLMSRDRRIHPDFFGIVAASLRLLVPGGDGARRQQRRPDVDPLLSRPEHAIVGAPPPGSASGSGATRSPTPSITTTRASPLLRSIQATARPSRRQIGGASTNTLPSAVRTRLPST